MGQARTQAKALADGGGAPRQAAGDPPRRPARGDEPPELLSSGSGVFVNDKGQLLTNAHVIDGCTIVGNESLGPGKLIALDEGSDLALLQFKDKPRGFVSFGPSALKLGDGVIAAGFPLSDVLNNGLNITSGNISALSGIHGDRRFVQITTPIQPGNSGGPLLDSSGRLVGIVSRGLKNEVVGEGRRTAQNVNYAVAPFIVEAFLQEHGIAFSKGRNSRETASSIAAKARAHTVRLECYG
jgi:S1-C subfamily serine protease